MNKYIVSFFGLNLLLFNTVFFSMELIEQQKNKNEGDIYLIECDEINQKIDSLANDITDHEKDLFVVDNQIKFQHQNILELAQFMNKNKGKENYNLLMEIDEAIHELRIFADFVTTSGNNLFSQAKQIKSQYQRINLQEIKKTYDETIYNRLNSLIRTLKELKECISFYKQQIKSQQQAISVLKQQVKSRLTLTDGMITSILDKESL